MTSKLIAGKIPANTACPFARECPDKTNANCAHTGAQHPTEFSCGYARLFDKLGPSKTLSGALDKART